MKKTGPVTFVSFAKGITYRIRGLIIRLHPNSPIFTCRLAILFSLVPAPSHLHTHKYRFPEDGDKKFQGSVRRRRVEYPSRNNYASVPRSSDRTRAVNYDPSRVVNGVLTIRLNVGRFERRMLVLPGFIFPFFFFFYFVHLFSRCYFSTPRGIFVVDPFRATDLRNASIYAPSCYVTDVHPCFFYFSTMSIFLSL